MKIKLVLVLLVFFMIGCKKKPIKKEIIGTWKLFEIYDGERNITKTRNPKNDRVITFLDDGTYTTTGSNYSDKIGKWTIDSVKNEIFMDSEGGSGDDSTWKLKFRNDTLFFTGKSYFVKTVKAKWIRKE